MTVSGVAPDYYAVLQVQPDADFEVIEAAYRQLMKKHHPDMAGDDPQRIAEHLRRAKALNEAFRVLRDPEQRRRYDLDRIVVGTVRPPNPTTSRPSSTPPPPRASAPPAEPTATAVQPAPETPWFLAPFTLLSTAYYLLPGTYEWEPGSGRELLTVILMPALALTGYALASGRFSPWIGHALTTTVAAWLVFALVAIVATWGSGLRVALASVPTLVLVSGWLDSPLQQAHVPVVVAWAIMSSLSFVLAARLYVFGVLPSLGVIWLLAQAS